jgi:hypothetical protein
MRSDLPRSHEASDRRPPRPVEAHVSGIDTALAASREAVDRLITAAAATGPAWVTPPAPGKWSPSQIVEHVARSFDASVNLAAGQPSAFPRLPTILHPILRIVLRQMLRRGAFPNGRTTKGMNPADGPLTPAEGRIRIDTAHDRYEAACRQLAGRGEPLKTPMFGPVRVDDFVRFMELHTRHHRRQIGVPDSPV